MGRYVVTSLSVLGRAYVGVCGGGGAGEGG